VKVFRFVQRKVKGIVATKSTAVTNSSVSVCFPRTDFLVQIDSLTLIIDTLYLHISRIVKRMSNLFS
jgi:uncharacterized protein (DUF779 family)